MVEVYHMSIQLKEKCISKWLYQMSEMLYCRCDVIGVGNGVACRETETVVSDLIQNTWNKLKYW